MSNVDELIKSLEVQLKKTEPARVLLEPVAQVLDARARGEAILARKFFTGGETQYKPGDPVEGLNDDQLAKLAAAGYLVPKSLHDRAQDAAEIKDLLGKAIPLKIRLQNARSDEQKAAIKAAEAEAKLRYAEDQLQQKSAFVATCESDLADFLAGEDINRLLDSGR